MNMHLESGGDDDGVADVYWCKFDLLVEFCCREELGCAVGGEGGPWQLVSVRTY